MFGSFIQPDILRSRKLNPKEKNEGWKQTPRAQTHKNENGVIEIKTNRFL